MNWFPCVFFFLPLLSSRAPAPRHEQVFSERRAYSSHILIISSKAETNLCNEVWPVLTDQTLSRGAGHVATAPQSTPKTQLNNQGFNCRIIPQSIKKGFLGCWMKLNRAPEEINKQNILARQMRRSETSGGWRWGGGGGSKGAVIQYAAAVLPNQHRRPKISFYLCRGANIHKQDT